MEQRVVLAGIPQPRKVLHDPVVGAREQVGVSPCPEALEPGALRLGWNAGPPRTELARRSDANDLAPQHICGIPHSIPQRPVVEHDPSQCVPCLERALRPQRVPAGAGRVLRESDIEKVVSIRLPPAFRYNVSHWSQASL